MTDTEKAGNTVTKHNAKPYQPEDSTGYGEVSDVFCGNVDAVFAADKATF